MAMDLYEKAGDNFFNGTRHRDQAVEFYRVLTPLNMLLMSLLSDDHGELQHCAVRVEGQGRKVERDTVILSVHACKLC